MEETRRFDARHPAGAAAAPAGPAAALAVLLISLGVLMPALAGCGRQRGAEVGAPAGGASRAAPAGAKEVEIAEDPVKTGIAARDAGLAGAVRARLAADPRLRRQRIEVDAEEGRVTLWGYAGSAQERTAAVEVARRTPGVTAVVDLIKVRASPGASSP
jgi:hyperosmotically inducible protein